MCCATPVNLQHLSCTCHTISVCCATPANLQHLSFYSTYLYTATTADTLNWPGSHATQLPPTHPCATHMHGHCSPHTHSGGCHQRSTMPLVLHQGSCRCQHTLLRWPLRDRDACAQTNADSCTKGAEDAEAPSPKTQKLSDPPRHAHHCGYHTLTATTHARQLALRCCFPQTPLKR